MTTNIDRVADVIYRETGDSYLVAQLTQALAAADLLAPDPVKPTDRSVPEWESPSNDYHAVSVSNYGTVRIWGDTSGYTPQEARDIAHRLLSAAACVEEHTNDQ